MALLLRWEIGIGAGGADLLGRQEVLWATRLVTHRTEGRGRSLGSLFTNVVEKRGFSEVGTIGGA
jgi:hypothetical protein